MRASSGRSGHSKYSHSKYSHSKCSHGKCSRSKYSHDKYSHDKCGRSRVSVGRALPRQEREAVGNRYPFDRAERFVRDVRKLGVSEAGLAARAKVP